MELVGERWSLLIVRELLLGPRRFGDLRSGLPGLSANVLTQRLEGLEVAGIVERRRLPAPANIQVYALTRWGEECESIVLGLGRWALRSPSHDPSLFFSPVALMLSLKMLLLAERAAGFSATIGMVLDGAPYVARFVDGAISVLRGETEPADAVLKGAPGAFKPVLFGGIPLAEAEASGWVCVTGDRAVAERFVTLFALPDRAG
jgi:DNA-binding HxlR family transcriptional regulator/putative sterol carrier protein